MVSKEKSRKKLWIFILVICLIIGVFMAYYRYIKLNDDTLSEANVQELSDKLDTGRYTVVYYGSETCSTCRTFVPIMKKEFKQSDIEFFYVNADNEKNNEFAKKMDLKKTPTLIEYQNMKELSRYEDDDVYNGMARICNKAE